MRRHPEVIWRPVEGRVVGLDLRSSRYFSLNESAALLWEELGEDVEAGTLSTCLMQRFGIEQTAADADVEAFLDEMRSSGLLEE